MLNKFVSRFLDDYVISFFISIQTPLPTSHKTSDVTQTLFTHELNKPRREGPRRHAKAALSAEMWSLR
jgi:hypothetical protein